MGISLPLKHGGIAAIDGGVTKVGTGALTLSGINTYTGNTTVSAGTLSLFGANLYDASSVHIDTGAMLNLTYGSATTDAVQFLFTGGYPEPAGVYNAGNLPAYIGGTGNLQALYTPLGGDANADGTVNGADLTTVLSNYNKTGMNWFSGDFSGDGTTNGADLTIVLSNYNQHLSLGAAVPEPSTLLLAAAGLVGLLAYAWRKRK